MDRPQFNVRAMFLSTALFAIAFGCIRWVHFARQGPVYYRVLAEMNAFPPRWWYFMYEPSFLFATWLIAGACLGSAVGVLFKQGRLWAICGALGTLITGHELLPIFQARE